MISRSSSTAGDKLRRAKSTSSSHHTASSGHQRHYASIDPFESRQQAAAAAAEAYERARQFELPSSRPVPLKLQRRRSQAAGKSEGSHFEDARRKSLAKEGDVPRARTQASYYSSSVRATDTGSDEERVITRRRSVIPPSSEVRHPQLQPPSSRSQTTRHARRRQSEYTDGSPMPRHSQTFLDDNSSLQAASLQANHTDGYGGDFNSLTPYDTMQSSPHPTPSRPSALPSHQVNTHDLNMARDRCLQDFQTKRVRERKSFIFRPFEKRRATTTAASNFDISLLPFNYAENGDGAPIPTNYAPAYSVAKTEQKARVLSGSLAGRLKKVFRKTSKVPVSMPPQQVEAKDFHYTVRDTDVSELDDTCVDFNDPFMTVAAEEPKRAVYSGINIAPSYTSAGRESDGKSRVTSWANSTVAGMSSIRTNDGPASAIRSTGLKRVDSKHSLRKASSFFGRPIRNKLRKDSKQELRGSDESQGLYSALQNRIRTARSMEPINTQPAQEALPTCNTSALATLPSQMQYSLGASSNRTASTIRAVTPVDPIAQHIGVPSPVKEVLSPEPDVGDDTVIHIEPDSPPSTAGSDLKRRPAVRAPRPSQEQLTRRVELSKNRWRSPLDELSPSIPHSSRFALMDQNPYELRSLSRTVRQSTPANDLPTHTRVAAESVLDPAAALSPSVYSRATDGFTPRPLSPEDLGLTRITITGREVRTYDISPPKTHKRGNGSSEWRKWLSDEINNWNPGQDVRAPPLGALPGAISEEAVQQNLSRRDSGIGTMPITSRHASASTNTHALSKDAELRRGRTPSETSTLSYMNERYPMIPTSRPGSRQSATTSRRVSSGHEHHHRQSVASSRKPSTESHRATILQTEEHDLEIPQTVPEYVAAAEARADEDQLRTIEEQPAHTITALTSTTNRASKSSLRPKSAYELRARFKTNVSDHSRPLEVRRKPIDGSILEDNTIVNISAGPYASQRLSSVGGGRENTPPLESPLPAMSSSEWLAAGSNKKREVKKASSMNPMGRPGKGSPGQKLVTSWLDGRKERERDGRGAFV